MDTKHKGARAELLACAWLLTNGYEVFRNVSGHGVADVVAWKPDTGETHFIDVKTVVCHTAKDGRVSIYCGAKADPRVRHLLVNVDRVIGFRDELFPA